jgi:two-component system chemotaxis sensor kinase CheA
MTKKQLIIDKQSNISIVKKNILVVDDSVTTRILERNILRAAGYNVTVATDGLDALTKLLSEKFDLVLSDIEMPEINGFELTERLRTDNRFKNIPIVLVTSLVSEADRRKGLDLGANAYITKGGFNQEELINTIRKLLG